MSAQPKKRCYHISHGFGGIDECPVCNYKPDQPKFEIRNEPKAAYIPSFRVTAEMHHKLKTISAKSCTPLPEILRQMIDFALVHMDAEKDLTK